MGPWLPALDQVVVALEDFTQDDRPIGLGRIKRKARIAVRGGAGIIAQRSGDILSTFRTISLAAQEFGAVSSRAEKKGHDGFPDRRRLFGVGLARVPIVEGIGAGHVRG